MNQRKKTLALCRGALIAALYVALTLACGMLGLANMPIQLRLSEALCVLPLLMPEAVWGLTVGCLVSNFTVGGLWQDIVFGTLATLLGALGTHVLGRLRGKLRLLGVIPPILSNAVIIPLVLKGAYGIGDGWFLLALLVFLGELLSVGVCGGFLLFTVDRIRKRGGRE